MVLLGCKPEGRNTEQHDIFFGIADSLPALVPQLKAFWPGKHTIHIDAWREVTQVGDYAILVTDKKSTAAAHNTTRLFFINLGGYKPGDFEEYHYKLIIAADSKSAAIREAKDNLFYKHTGFKGAESHVDDKYGIDVDDSYQIEELLSATTLAAFSLSILPNTTQKEDSLHIGYTKLSSLNLK
ncbi:MAG: DUF1543 domain-containing protein [Sediminibacterium sp.]|nr:DUF1543 domain-containing protein [Sediminibacterium sp.]